VDAAGIGIQAEAPGDVPENVRMGVDQAGQHQAPGAVDDLAVRRVQSWADRCDPAIAHPYVADRVEPRGGVDDTAALQQGRLHDGAKGMSDRGAVARNLRGVPRIYRTHQNIARRDAGVSG
jgi:hypothetical protein